MRWEENLSLGWTLTPYLYWNCPNRRSLFKRPGKSKKPVGTKPSIVLCTALPWRFSTGFKINLNWPITRSLLTNTLCQFSYPPTTNFPVACKSTTPCLCCLQRVCLSAKKWRSFLGCYLILAFILWLHKEAKFCRGQWSVPNYHLLNLLSDSPLFHHKWYTKSGHL